MSEAVPIATSEAEPVSAVETWARCFETAKFGPAMKDMQPKFFQCGLSDAFW